MSADMRFGDYRDVMRDVECDAMIVDAPYSDRTHKGHNQGVEHANEANQDGRQRRAIGYSAWTGVDVQAFVEFWTPRTRSWFLSITDHVLAPAWEGALKASGRYVFPPVPLIDEGAGPRYQGDGPASATCWVIVSRPREKRFLTWGSLPPVYSFPREPKPVIGGKSLAAMRALVRDYSRPGDLVCDPCAGGGTTLLAALTEGRRAVGSEMDPEHYAIAKSRLARGYTPPLFLEGAR
jgi:hypothetical protein